MFLHHGCAIFSWLNFVVMLWLGLLWLQIWVKWRSRNCDLKTNGLYLFTYYLWWVANIIFLFLGTFRDSSGSFGLTPDGQIQKLPVKLKLHGDREVVKISSGADHLAMLTIAGELYTIGEWAFCTIVLSQFLLSYVLN